MKICRFNHDRLGLVKDDQVYDVTDVLERLPLRRWPEPLGDQLIANFDDIVGALRTRTLTSAACTVAEAFFQNPVPNASKIVAAPVNYENHLAEARLSTIGHGKDVQRIAKAGLFLKSTSSLVGASDGVELRFPDRRSDHEIELVAIIGRTCNEIAPDDALSYVAAYTMGLDMSLRGKEDRSFRKSLDSYTVIGPWLVTADEIPHPENLALEIRVNGEIKQKSRTSEQLAPMKALVSWASMWYTLYPGDIIMSGTPEGISQVQDGDVMDCAIEKIGTMRVKVRASKTTRAVAGWALSGHVLEEALSAS
jgi:2-keto-4-pentenoate hydratase/2-oxohepta-3-ene-1,7-dioic acid hydratase in catechol pathway